jgi:DNA processing protein
MLPQQAEAQILLPANDEERTLLKLLSSDPQHIDELIRVSDLSAQLVSSTLTMMELKGFVRHLGGMQYALTR